jgi:hypothetical protein
VPAGLENLYQIDVRAKDMLGNVAISSNLWRGIIDTAEPRLVMTANATGASYLDAAANQRHYAVHFVCAAVDRYLEETTFECPGEALAEPTRSFVTIPVLQTLFPDMSIRNGLALSYTLWTPTINLEATVAACDSSGHCATTSSSAAGTPTDSPPAGTFSSVPQAVIVAPAAGSFVAATDAVAVTVSAEASASLKEVVISLDGAVVQTLSFAQDEAVTDVQRTLQIPVASEGLHTLVAQATDWAGSTQSTLFPISFTLDQSAPSVTIDSSALTSSDTWQMQSGVLRFNGTVSDGVGLATVQVREQETDFVDAIIEGDTWRVALAVADPEGRTLTIIVRAIDQAGRITEVTQQIATELSIATAPDTSIVSGPPEATTDTGATLAFAGTEGAVIFDCQLDDGLYTTCGSPTSYSDLSKGSHTFRVRAIDSQGFVDLSPAIHTWTVNAGAVDATITNGPGDLTSSHSAIFDFTGSGASSFECSLDGAAYVPCTSPQSYDGLGHGKHTFLVRGRSGESSGAADRYRWTIANAAPVAAGQELTTTMETALAVTLNASDDEPLLYKLVDSTVHGVLRGTPPALTYTPDSGFTGVDTFRFVADDALLLSNVATISITVAAGNRLPTAGDDRARAALNSPVIVDVLANDADPDGDTLTITSNSTPANGAATAENGKITYTPNAGFTGSDTFTYTVGDGKGGTASATVTVDVGIPVYLPVLGR